jgi:hypothetical protein
MICGETCPPEERPKDNLAGECLVTALRKKGEKETRRSRMNTNPVGFA